MKFGTHPTQVGILFSLAFLVCIESARSEWNFQLVYSFGTAQAIIARPNTGLTLGPDGSFYGAGLINGYSTAAALFRLSADGQLTNLYTFSYPNPYAYYANRLAIGHDGNIYGTASALASTDVSQSPSVGKGFLFRMTPNGVITFLATFWGTNDGTGGGPLGTVIQSSDGSLLGTTLSGGTSSVRPQYGLGTIFQFRTEGIYSGLLSFSFDGTNGYAPRGGLIQATDGNFYGTTSDNASYYSGSTRGTIFRISPKGFTTLYTFNGTDGFSPSGGLLQAQDGALYGTTAAGTIFRITTNGVFTNLFRFNGANGSNPTGELIQLNDGNLYGTTAAGGSNNLGTIFRITTNGVLTTVFHFDGSHSGGSPQGGLCLGRDGNLYGTTSAYGPADPSGYPGGGTIFRLVSSPVMTSLLQSNGVVLNWTSFTNAVYRVEYRTNMISGSWLTLADNLISSGTTTSFIDSATGEAQRFYRITLLPH